MKQEIIFTPETKFAEQLLTKPIPGSQAVPDWYRHAEARMDGQKTSGIDGYQPTSATNVTYKHCSPFLDAFLTGYIWEAPVDFEVMLPPGANRPIVRWRTEGNFVSDHSPPQHPNLPEPEDTYQGVLKWEFPFAIKTPPGYSTLFTHPLNRYELPFRTLSGVVDTDVYPLAVKFPFQLLNFTGERIIIEQGTPLCQMIPVKRDDWESSVGEADEQKVRANFFQFAGKIVRSYKTQWWHRKSYK